MYVCDIKSDLFSDTRICKSKFIATDNRYLNSQIDVKINSRYNIIELYVDKKYSLKGDISLSIAKDEYNMLTLGYGNFIFEYGKGKKQDIDITNMSLGYEFSYDRFDLYFYSRYSFGISEYKLDVSKDGYFLASTVGIKKKVLGVNLGVFGYFSKSFIDDLELNTISLGVSIGL